MPTDLPVSAYYKTFDSTKFKKGKPDNYKKDDDHSNISSAVFFSSDDDHFLFGSGTSAYQVEGGYVKGGKTLSIWDVLCLSNPGGIADGSNGNLACNSYRKYKEDLRVMNQMGFNSYRFSISWPRILPGGRSCFGINRKGIAYYNDIIDTCIANGLEPFVTLFHWDIPDCLELEYGGFLSERVINDFREFAETCFWEFGDRVKHWTTLNEPWTYAHGGYIKGGFLNIKRYSNNSLRNNSEAPYKVAKNLLLAHSEAVHSYRKKFQKRQNGKIGISLNSHWFVPKNPESPKDEDIKAAERGVDFMLGWFLDPLLSGEYPESMKKGLKENRPKNMDSVDLEAVAGFSSQEKDKLKGSIDFLGLNYYTTYYAEHFDPELTAEDLVLEQKSDAADSKQKSNAADSNQKSNVEDSKPKSNYEMYRNVKITKKYEGESIGEQAGSEWLYSVPWGLYEHLKYLKEKLEQMPRKNKDDKPLEGSSKPKDDKPLEGSSKPKDDKPLEGSSKPPPIYITENGWCDASDFNKTPKQACDDPNRMKYHQDHLFYLHKAIKDLKVDVKGYFAWSWCDNFEWSQGYKERFGLMYVDFLNEYERYPKNSAVWFTEFLAGAAERKKNKTNLEIILKKLLDHEAKDSKTDMPSNVENVGINPAATKTITQGKNNNGSTETNTQGENVTEAEA